MKAIKAIADGIGTNSKHADKTEAVQNLAATQATQKTAIPASAIVKLNDVVEKWLRVICEKVEAESDRWVSITAFQSTKKGK
jgi:hypothetical protein